MQLSRVAIAAVFVVVGLLIAVPMFTGSSSKSRASSTPSVSVSPTATPTRGRTSSAAPRTSHPAAKKTTPKTGAPAAGSPLSVSVGAVHCPGRTVQVKVTNTGGQTEDYAITSNGSTVVADRIGPKTTRKSAVTVSEDKRTKIAVTWHGRAVHTKKRTANCVHKTAPTKLPYTGTSRGLLFARIATAIAALLTGAIIFWYGRQWPHRRGRMFD